MIEQTMKYLPLLLVASSLNVLFGVYNSVFVKKNKFKLAKLFNGIIKAALFAVGIFGVSYIMDSIEIPLAVMTPEVILETSTFYYTSKVLAHLYRMIVPTGETLDSMKKKSKETFEGTTIQMINLDEEDL